MSARRERERSQDTAVSCRSFGWLGSPQRRRQDATMMITRQRLYCAAIVCLGLVGLSTIARTQSADTSSGPDPREIPVPRIATTLGTLPGVSELPVRAAMPDVMAMNDGTRVTSRRQWEARRQEMRRILSYYSSEICRRRRKCEGPRDSIGARPRWDREVPARCADVWPQKNSHPCTSACSRPKGGPFPPKFFRGGTPPGGTVLPRLPQGPNQGRGENVRLVGPVPSAAASAPVASAAPARGGRGLAAPPTAASIATQRADVFKRGYALVLFNPNDCAEDTTLRNLDGSWAFRNTRFFPAYPGYDWGILAGWAWVPRASPIISNTTRPSMRRSSSLRERHATENLR